MNFVLRQYEDAFARGMKQALPEAKRMSEWAEHARYSRELREDLMQVKNNIEDMERLNGDGAVGAGEGGGGAGD